MFGFNANYLSDNYFNDYFIICVIFSCYLINYCVLY